MSKKPRLSLRGVLDPENTFVTPKLIQLSTVMYDKDRGGDFYYLVQKYVLGCVCIRNGLLVDTNEYAKKGIALVTNDQNMPFVITNRHFPCKPFLVNDKSRNQLMELWQTRHTNYFASSYMAGAPVTLTQMDLFEPIMEAIGYGAMIYDRAMKHLAAD